MKNFWQKINKPIYALAPMAGVTDAAFRQIVKDFGADVVYSEMASATALVFNPAKTLELLNCSSREKPYVAQLFGANPEHFATAAKLVTKEIKPQGLDINFGCPVKKVQKQGAGAILMSDLNLSYQVVKSVIGNTSLPVSIKCRASVGNITVLDFLEKIKDLDVKAVMIHGRTMSQGHAGKVDMGIIKAARNSFDGIILANGGVVDLNSGQELLNATGADGLGIARGALGRPWIFEELKTGEQKTPSREEVFKIAIKQAKLTDKFKGKQGIVEMRKHLCWYVKGLPDAAELRQKLVKVGSLREIEKTMI